MIDLDLRPSCFYRGSRFKCIRNSNISESGLLICSGDWTITGAPLDLRDPRILAVAAAQRRLLEAEYDEYGGTDANGAAFCRSAALIVSIYYFQVLLSSLQHFPTVQCFRYHPYLHFGLWIE
jgi:hypothetical protein